MMGMIFVDVSCVDTIADERISFGRVKIFGLFRVNVGRLY